MKGIKWISLFLVLSLMVPIVLAEDVRIVLQGEKNSYIAGENIVVKVFIEAEDFTYPFDITTAKLFISGTDGFIVDNAFVTKGNIWSSVSGGYVAPLPPPLNIPARIKLMSINQVETIENANNNLFASFTVPTSVDLSTQTITFSVYSSGNELKLGAAPITFDYLDPASTVSVTITKVSEDSCDPACDQYSTCLEGSCVAYGCSGGSITNSVMCENDDFQLAPNTMKTVVTTCTDETKCEYVCNPGFIKNGDTCVEETCEPVCEGKGCGPDGCGGSCGTCADGTSCNSEGACIAEDVDFCADYTQFGDFYDSINQGLNDFSGLADISACFKRMDDVYGIDKYFLDSKSSSNKIECVEIYKGIPIIKRDFNGVDWFQIIYMASNNIYFDVSYYFFNGCDGYVNGDTYKRHFTTLESLKNCIDNPTQLINLNSYTYADINCQAPVCVPQCDGKECGSDGCGGSCGTCADGTCNAAGVCESPTTKISGPLNTLILRTDCILNSTCIQGDAEYGYVESKLNQVARIAKALRSYYQEVTLCIGDGNCQTVQPNQEGMTDEVITLTNGMIAALEPDTTANPSSVTLVEDPLSATANIVTALKDYYATE